MTNRLMQSLDPPTRQRVAALEQAAAAGEEPGAAAVAAAFPPLRHHSTIVGVAHHRDRIHVCWDGTLVSVGVAQVRMTLGAERTPWRELAAEPTHVLLDGFLPVVVTTLRYADLVVRQTVVGYSEELSPDRALLALARLEVRNAHAAAATAHVGFRFERGLTLPEARADADARFGDHALVRDGRFVEWENGGLIAACDAAFAAAAEWRGHTLAGALAVPAGAAPASSCGWRVGRWRRRSAPRSPTPSSTRWWRPRRAVGAAGCSAERSSSCRTGRPAPRFAPGRSTARC